MIFQLSSRTRIAAVLILLFTVSSAQTSVPTLLGNVWAMAVLDATTNAPYVREYSGFITLNTATDKYELANVTCGNWYGPGDDPEMKISARPKDIPPNPSPLDKPIYYVAWFHTHAPLYRADFHEDGDGRFVGPSQEDFDASNHPSMKLPGFVVDYVGEPTPTGTSVILVGHPIDAPIMIYPITPPERRPLP